jgi:hypothetical protein
MGPRTTPYSVLNHSRWLAVDELITYGGRYDRDDGYTDNVVVTANAATNQTRRGPRVAVFRPDQGGA